MPKIIKHKKPGRPVKLLPKEDKTKKEDEPDEPINNYSFSCVKMEWNRHIVEL